jgi:poly(A) polymerase
MQVNPPAWLHDLALLPLFDAFENAGSTVRLVGGVVRDMVRGAPENSMPADIDMATPMTPEEALSMLQSHGFKVIPTGLKHGTITVVLPAARVEITTLRRDAVCHGRHADVAFTDVWAEDARRRDFTMNALYVSRDGTLYDEVGGLADAKAGRVRFIGDATVRITEDYLRMLRFYRFVAQLNTCEIDEQAQAAIGACAPHIASISGERVQQEMRKLLQAKAPYVALAAMQQAGLLEAILLPRDVLVCLQILQELHPHWLVRLACLAQTSFYVETITKRWKLSRADSSRLQRLVMYHVPAGAVLLQHQQLIYTLGYDDYVAVCALSAAQQNAPKMMQQAQALRDWPVPVFPLRAADLQARGLEGKPLGDALRRLEEKWVMGGFR